MKSRERHHHQTHISVELADEAGEVVVLEILGQQILGELRGVPHHEAVVLRPPRNDRVRRRIVHHVVRLAQERRRRGGRRRAAVGVRARRPRRSGVRRGAVHRSVLHWRAIAKTLIGGGGDKEEQKRKIF